MEGTLIAVVDDDKTNLMITSSMLKERGMRICAFRSGVAFLK